MARVAFGTKESMLFLGFHGTLTESEGETLTRDLIALVGMQEGPGSAMFRYPERNLGWTHFRCLVESSVVLDWWTPCGDRPAGGYLTVTSCKDFDAGAVIAFLESRGMMTVSSHTSEAYL